MYQLAVCLGMCLFGLILGYTAGYADCRKTVENIAKAKAAKRRYMQ